MGRRKFKQQDFEGVEIVDTATDGKGIGKLDGQVFFVEKTVPGDVVDIKVRQKKKKQLIASVEKFVAYSPDRITPRCEHFGNCGGCKWQSLDYSKQLHYKEKFVRDAIDRIAKVPYQEFHPVLGCETAFEYRNKVEFSFSNKRWVPQEVIDTGEEVDFEDALGYHVARFFDKIIQVETCHLHRPVINEIRNEVWRYSREKSIPFYDIREHTGFLRNVVFRTSEGTGELMMNLIVGEDDPEKIDMIFTHLHAQFPQITSFVWIYNNKLNSSYSDLAYRSWKGPDYITEHLGDWKYRVSPTSFFQTNTLQAKVLYDVVRKFAGEDKYGIVYDLYCGAGSIGIYVSDLADKVVGIEYVEDAIVDARANLKLNDLDHFSFHAGDMRKLLTDELVASEGKPDLIITDPPRAGMDERVTRQILKLGAPKIIYVSCNPATQARDIAILDELYEVVTVQPVDMFPQTAHVENVVLLQLKSSNQ